MQSLTGFDYNPITQRYLSRLWAIDDCTATGLNRTNFPWHTKHVLIKMKGNPMADAHIPDNALLLVEACKQPQPNSIVLAMVKEEFLVRRYVENSSGARLMPANLKFDPIPLTTGMDYRMLGKVIRVIIDITTG